MRHAVPPADEDAARTSTVAATATNVDTEGYEAWVGEYYRRLLLARPD